MEGPLIVEEVRKLRPDDFRPTEKLIVQLMQSMIAGGLKDHPAFEELWCLLGELVPGPDQDLGRSMLTGRPSTYVDEADEDGGHIARLTRAQNATPVDRRSPQPLTAPPKSVASATRSW